ncbi:MAG TPA: YetF domain-containing protein [Candidatus Dormibacteraeota bacterium]|nr:YetF domain-containing protein [Candidatus Dormibacteraeota bacterium]
MKFLELGVPWWELILRSAAIYLALLFGFRIFGKREVGQMTLFDLVVVLLVANAVQPAMTGPDASITGGLIIIVTLLLLNHAISFVRVRVPWFNKLVEPSPVVVARNGQWMREELKKQELTDEEALAALREHGLESVAETKEVVLEADGSLSVVPKDGAQHHHRRHVRFIRHN